MGYENPVSAAYFFPGVTIDTEEVIGRIIGPRNMVGILKGIGCVVTVEVDGAAGAIKVGSEGDDDAYGELAVAEGAADTLNNNPTIQTSSGLVTEMTKNTAVEVLSSGASTNGDGDVAVYIDWYGG